MPEIKISTTPPVHLEDDLDRVGQSITELFPAENPGRGVTTILQRVWTDIHRFLLGPSFPLFVSVFPISPFPNGNDQ